MRAATPPSQHADNCSLCPEGRYQQLSGRTVCKKCPIAKFSDEEGAKSCKDCNIWEFAERPGETNCDNCFTIESAFGFAYPAQCIVIWVILGTLGGLIALAVSLKFCSACGSCCAAILTMCKGDGSSSQEGSTIIIKEGGYSSDEDEDLPPKVPEIEMKKVKKTNTLNIMGDGSESDEEIVYDE